MRNIGHLSNKASAAAFSDYLYVNGISNIIESDKDGYSIWIHSEDELEKARDLLTNFQRNPGDPKYAQHSRDAQELKDREEREERAAEKRHFDRERIFKTKTWFGPGPLTIVLIAASVIATLAISFGYKVQVFAWFAFDNPFTQATEVVKGEVWRLITPIFLHASLTGSSMGFLHLPLNMLWIYDLGGMIEQRQGTRRFFILVVVIAALSNAAQYYHAGPIFGGMSGVVYGLLGYAWMKGKFDPESGLFLHPQTVTMMLVWFFLCLFGFIPNVANAAHGGGLVVGMVWGYLSSLLRSR
jgi:GlpG protein